MAEIAGEQLASAILFEDNEADQMGSAGCLSPRGRMLIGDGNHTPPKSPISTLTRHHLPANTPKSASLLQTPDPFEAYAETRPAAAYKPSLAALPAPPGHASGAPSAAQQGLPGPRSAEDVAALDPFPMSGAGLAGAGLAGLGPFEGGLFNPAAMMFPTMDPTSAFAPGILNYSDFVAQFQLQAACQIGAQPKTPALDEIRSPESEDVADWMRGSWDGGSRDWGGKGSWKGDFGKDYSKGDYGGKGDFGKGYFKSGKGDYKGGESYKDGYKGGKKGGDGKGFFKGGDYGDWGSRRDQAVPAMLQEFRRGKRYELCDITKHITDFAKDQYGSRFIQQRFEVATLEEKKVACDALLNDVSSLVTDVFGNYVVQKAFEYGTEEQKVHLIKQLKGNVQQYSVDMYGCRVVQRAIESHVAGYRDLMKELEPVVLACVENQNGNHVIQKCIEAHAGDEVQFIVDAIQSCVLKMAVHCYGCRVIQRLIENCPTQQMDSILTEIMSSVQMLAQDQYGNYVVQHVLTYSKRPGDRETIMQMIRDQLFTLSAHKFASNTVECAVKVGLPDEVKELVSRVLKAERGGAPQLNEMVVDRYANYVIQKMMEVSQGEQKKELYARLHDQMDNLRKCTYGRYIVTTLDREANGTTRPPRPNRGEKGASKSEGKGGDWSKGDWGKGGSRGGSWWDDWSRGREDWAGKGGDSWDWGGESWKGSDWSRSGKGAWGVWQ
mmetsp:Transcript_32674/g.84699  ORF Transcript_32674/g.84699 Transcript_32674/m.84699 type:complete len:720 (+) Transcript_32674:122-2281(+)